MTPNSADIHARTALGCVRDVSEGKYQLNPGPSLNVDPLCEAEIVDISQLEHQVYRDDRFKRLQVSREETETMMKIHSPVL